MGNIIIKTDQKLNGKTSLLQLLFPTLSANEERQRIIKRPQIQQVRNQSEHKYIATKESVWNTKPLPLKLYEAQGTRDYIDNRQKTSKGAIPNRQNIEHITQGHKTIDQVLKNISFSSILKYNISNNSDTQITKNIRQNKITLNKVVRNKNTVEQTQKLQAQINLNKAE